MVEDGGYHARLHQRRDLIDLRRSTRFTMLAEGFPHEQVIPHASYAPWRSAAEFRRLRRVVRDHTMVDDYRCHEL